MLKFEDIQVIVINKTLFDKAIDESIKEELAKCVGSALAPQLKEGESFRSGAGKLAIVDDTNILIDDECIVKVCNEGFIIDVYSDIKTETQNSFGVFPRFTITLSVDNLLKYADIDTVDIITFMGGRYNYNPRIEGNQAKLLYKLKNLT